MPGLQDGKPADHVGAEEMKKPAATQWKLIEGTWKWPYRISDQGDVQKQLPSGRWRDLKPYMYSGQLRIQMWIDDVSWKRVQISKLVADAFMGGTPPGMLRIHKNSMRHDNAIENIAFMTRAEAAKRCRPGNRKAVAKVNANGEVVAIYDSTAEAARKNYISQAAISKQCRGDVKNPYSWDGFNYVFADSLELDEE